MLLVDSPEVVRRQAVPLWLGARKAIAVLVLLMVLLATGWVPGAITAMVCAVLAWSRCAALGDRAGSGDGAGSVEHEAVRSTEKGHEHHREP